MARDIWTAGIFATLVALSGTTALAQTGGASGSGAGGSAGGAAGAGAATAGSSPSTSGIGGAAVPGGGGPGTSGAGPGGQSVPGAGLGTAPFQGAGGTSATGGGKGAGAAVGGIGGPVPTQASLGPEERDKVETQMRAIHLKQTANLNVKLAVGSVMPTTLEKFWEEVPTDVVKIVPAWNTYRVARIHDNLVIVNPTTRKVVFVTGG